MKYNRKNPPPNLFSSTPANNRPPRIITWEEFMAQRNRYINDLSKSLKHSNQNGTVKTKSRSAKLPDELFD